MVSTDQEREAFLSYFEPLSNDYEVKFYLDKLFGYFIRKNKNEQESKNWQGPRRREDSNLLDARTRNRRFNFVQQQLKQPQNENDSFFSMPMMKFRHPTLFHEYIGRFTPDSSSPYSVPFESSMPLSERLLVNYDLDRMTRRQKTVERRENQGEGKSADRLEDSDSDDEDYDDEQEEEEEEEQEEEEEEEQEENDKIEKETTKEEQEQLRNEFIRIMQNKFISGEEAEFFDYSLCDTDERLDDLDQVQKDAEEKYFCDQDDTPSKNAKGTDKKKKEELELEEWETMYT